MVGFLGGRLFSIGNADDDPGNVFTLGKRSHSEHDGLSSVNSVVSCDSSDLINTPLEGGELHNTHPQCPSLEGNLLLVI